MLREPDRAAGDVVHPALLLGLLAAVVALCYAPALGGGFFWDDRLLVVESPLVVEGRPLVEYFSQPFLARAGANLAESYFRPLTTLSYRFDSWLWDGNPTGFHVTNLLLHELNVLVLYGLLRRRAGALAALAAAALFALAPRLTESVAWISGRTDVLATSFTLGALALFRPESTWRRWAAALLLLPALLAKEVALAGVFALLVLGWQSAPAGRRLVRLLPPLLALGAYAALRVGLFHLTLSGTSLGALGRAATALEAAGRYALALLDPWRPLAIQGQVGAPSLPLALLGALALGAVAAALVWRRRELRDDAPALVLTAASLGLVLHLVPLPLIAVSADRFLYLPLAGLALVLAPRLERWGRRSPAVRLALAALIASFAVFTFRRAALFADELAFWLNEQRRLPSAEVTVSVELGNVFTRLGLDREALALYERGLRQASVDRRHLALESSARALARLGKTTEARRRFEELAKSRHGRLGSERGLALLDLQEERFDTAEARLKKLARAGQLVPGERALIGDISVLRRMARALQDPARAASASGVLLAARYYTALDRLPEALPLWQRVLDEQGPAPATDALGRIIALGDHELMGRAVERYRRRFGDVPPALRDAYDLRRRELEAALAAKKELAL